MHALAAVLSVSQNGEVNGGFINYLMCFPRGPVLTFQSKHFFLSSVGLISEHRRPP